MITHTDAVVLMVQGNAPLITATRTAPPTEDADLNATPGAATTHQAYCVSDPESGDVSGFRALSLINATAKRLFCVPKIENEPWKANDALTWNGEAYRVKDVQDVDPLQSAIGFYASIVQ